MLAGEGASIPAPACSPGSGLRASAPARSAWTSPTASWLERAHCTTSPPGPQLWWKIKASGWRSLTAFTCFKGAGHRLPIWQANKPTLKAATFFLGASLHFCSSPVRGSLLPPPGQPSLPYLLLLRRLLFPILSLKHLVTAASHFLSSYG